MKACWQWRTATPIPRRRCILAGREDFVCRLRGPECDRHGAAAGHPVDGSRIATRETIAANSPKFEPAVGQQGLRQSVSTPVEGSGFRVDPHLRLRKFSRSLKSRETPERNRAHVIIRKTNRD